MKAKVQLFFRLTFSSTRVSINNSNKMLRIIKSAQKFNNLRPITANFARHLATAAQPRATSDPVEKGAPATENLSFIVNLFHGQLEGKEVFPYPTPLNEDQLDTIRMLADPVQKIFEEDNDPFKNDKDEKIDSKFLSSLWNLGFFGSQAPIELGGSGLNNTQLARLAEIVGEFDLGVAVTLAAHQSIGFKGILLYGNTQQKEKYLPRVTSGEFAAFCLTEPTAGSDANSIRSKAVLSPDGKHYILNGSKIWISNGGWAEVLTVFAQTPITDPKTGEVKDKVTAFIVERGFGGVTSGQPEKKMGIKGSNTTEVFFEDVKIPVENVLGSPGEGFKIAMNILNNGRFGMAACMSGTMRGCIKKAADFAKNRVQFGKTIDSYQGVQEKFARMAMYQYVTESLAYMIAGNMDKGSTNYHLETAVAKIFSSEAAWYVCDESIQILGGMGFMRESGLERVLRDLRIFRIFEGANDILRLFIVLTAVQNVGGHLKELQNALKHPTENLGLILGEASKRIVRTVGLSSSPSMDHLVHKDLVSSSKQVSDIIADFGETVEKILVKQGKNIINEQMILNRLSNATIDIYTSVVVLSRASESLNKNLSTAAYEKSLAEAWVFEAMQRAKQNLKTVNSGRHMENFSKLRSVGENVCKNGGIVQTNPLNF